jgi:ABC-type transport system substrate-binding protein
MIRLGLIAILGLAALGANAQSPAPADPFRALRVFVGEWQGPTSGKPGTGTTTREYRFELNGHFLWQHDRSVYQTSSPGTPQFVHEDQGYFSYDSGQKKILWMQFHSEGLVNEYVLESVSADGKEFEFLTTGIENLPGFRAKKLYRILSPDAIDETFWLAAPEKDFELYTVTHLRRVK